MQKIKIQYLFYNVVAHAQHGKAKGCIVQRHVNYYRLKWLFDPSESHAIKPYDIASWCILAKTETNSAQPHEFSPTLRYSFLVYPSESHAVLFQSNFNLLLMHPSKDRKEFSPTTRYTTHKDDSNHVFTMWQQPLWCLQFTACHHLSRAASGAEDFISPDRYYRRRAWKHKDNSCVTESDALVLRLEPCEPRLTAPSWLGDGHYWPQKYAPQVQYYRNEHRCAKRVNSYPGQVPLLIFLINPESQVTEAH
jgi:hypothetical protein